MSPTQTDTPAREAAMTLADRLKQATRDIETGEPLDPGTFAHVTVEDAIEAASRIEALEAELARRGEPVASSPVGHTARGAALKQARSDRGISLRSFARELGISPTTLTRIERGEAPDMKTAVAILPFAGSCACCEQTFPISAIATELEAVKTDLDRAAEKILPLDEALTNALAELERVKQEAVEALEFYANPAIYAHHPHGPAFDRRDISYRARSTLAAICGDDELPPNYAACCSSTNLAACDCVNKQHIRVLFARGGRKYQPTGGRL